MSDDWTRSLFSTAPDRLPADDKADRRPRPMIRKAFVMTVHPGCEAEYEKRHRPIWPELEATLRAHGVRRYSIFLEPRTRQLFAYAEVEDEARWLAIVIPSAAGTGSNPVGFASCAKGFPWSWPRPRATQS